MEKEIWTIEDIKKEFDHQGLSGRSKQDFLDNVQKKLKVLEILWDQVEFVNKGYWYMDFSSGQLSKEDKELIEEVM